MQNVNLQKIRQIEERVWLCRYKQELVFARYEKISGKIQEVKLKIEQNYKMYQQLSCNCSNLLQVYEIFFDDSKQEVIIIVPYEEYDTLADVLTSKIEEYSIIGDKSKVFHIANQIISTLFMLQHFKNPIVHGDVHPGNILLLKTNLKVVLVNFLHEDFRLFTTFTSNGFLYANNYAAPEVLAKKLYTNHTDFYSFGCILYQLFTSEIPFSAEAEHTIFVAKQDIKYLVNRAHSFGVNEEDVFYLNKCFTKDNDSYFNLLDCIDRLSRSHKLNIERKPIQQNFKFPYKINFQKLIDITEPNIIKTVDNAKLIPLAKKNMLSEPSKIDMSYSYELYDQVESALLHFFQPTNQCKFQPNVIIDSIDLIQNISLENIFEAKEDLLHKHSMTDMSQSELQQIYLDFLQKSISTSRNSNLIPCWYIPHKSTNMEKIISNGFTNNEKDLFFSQKENAGYAIVAQLEHTTISCEVLLCWVALGTVFANTPTLRYHDQQGYNTIYSMCKQTNMSSIGRRFCTFEEAQLDKSDFDTINVLEKAQVLPRVKVKIRLVGVNPCTDQDRSALLDIVKNQPLVMQVVHPQMKRDMQFVLDVVKFKPCAFSFADKSLKNNNKFLLDCVKQNGYTLQYMIQNEDSLIMQEACKQQPAMLKILPKHIQDLIKDKFKSYWEKEINNNNTIVMVGIGQCFETTIFGEPNFVQANQLYHKAHHLGNSTASCYLALNFKNNRGVNTDLQQSQLYLNSAVAKNNPFALYLKTLEYLEPKNVEAFLYKANALLHNAALMGNTDALLLLSTHYQNGIGVASNFVLADALLHLAAYLHNTKALNQVAQLLDKDKCLTLLRHSVELGCTDAMYLLGMKYFEGKDCVKNLKKANELFERASSLQHTNATLQFAKNVLEGNGISKDFEKAKKLFKQVMILTKGELGLADKRLIERVLFTINII